MKSVSCFCTLTSALLASTLHAAPKVHLGEFHNPQFHAPLHDTAPTPASETENHPRYRPARFDVLHYDIDIDVEPVTGTIAGSVGLVVKSTVPTLKEIDLDAVHMQIEQITIGQDQIPFTYDGTVVTALLPQPLLQDQQLFLRVAYKALMPQTLQVAAPDVTNPERMHNAYTYTQPEGSSYWYPCLDRPADKATLTLRVAVPDGFNALSNGDLLSQDSQNGRTAFSYRMDYPVATYLVSLAIGNYEVFDIGSFKHKALTLWAPPNIRDAAQFETARTKQMMEVFSEFTGVDYPFNSYATSVAQGWRSSMEHQSATTMGAWRITGDGSGEGVVAHELAHQWFGDWITCRTWGELWLNEGYASYLPYVFFQATGDEVRALGQLDYWRYGYFDEASTSVHPLSSANPNMDDIFDSHAYEKGALTIHLMRWIANRSGPHSPDAEETYTKVLRRYLTAKAGSTVTNYDHEKALADVTGRSWDIFFDQWVRSEGHPVLSVRSRINGNTVDLDVEQSQYTRAERKWRTFTFPLEVELVLADGTTEYQILDVYDDIQTFKLQASAPVVAVNPDPELILPAEITTDLPAANWQRVMQHSGLTTSRLSAMRALAASLGNIADQTFTDLVVADPSEYIRAAAVDELTGKPENRAAVMAIYRSLLTRGSDNVATAGAVARAEEWLVKTIGRIPTRDEERSWQSRYLNSQVVAERKALLGMLEHASAERSQTFAIERLQEGRWVMQDRWALIDLLSRKPGPASKAWLLAAVQDSAIQYQRLVVSNLTNAGYDDPDFTDATVTVARSHRNYYTREIAVKFLAKQVSSKDIVCPELAQLSRLPSAAPDMLAGVRSAAQSAMTSLNCIAE
jgi:aminopeptidase N